MVYALLPRYGLYTLLSDILPALCAFVILPLISTLSGVQATFKTVCTTCAHNAPTAHASLHKKGTPNFVHLHRVPQPFVLREIENHVTGGRKTVHSSVHSTSHDKISYRTQQFYTLRNGCCQGVVDSCSTTLHNYLRTVQTSVDKRADECRQVCRHFPMLPELHSILIFTQFSIISTERRHFCKQKVV